ncbi:MAG: DUF368 domain-containing protein [bacterium]
MGIADVIPGVSGGTIALIVGVYRELIRTLKKLNLRWVSPLMDLVLLRRFAEPLDQIKVELNRMNMGFLVPLVVGILSAVVVGSSFIPDLLADYPAAVKALFFGLILGSVWIPFRMVDEFQFSKLLPAVLVGITLAILGFYVSNPNVRLSGATQWVSVTSEKTTFKRLLESVPSSKPAHRVYWSSKNQSFRSMLRQRKPDLADRLRSVRQRGVDELSPKDAAKARSEPYETITVPSGLSLQVPRLSYWYVFTAGFLAISAMILPGISGSYILLILGAYFFVLNSVHGYLSAILSGVILSHQALIILFFTAGTITGLLLFTRVLDYFLTNWTTLTASGLSGLMLGCLRGVWPFQRIVEGQVWLIIPPKVTGTVWTAGTMFLLGLLAVTLLTVLTNPRRSNDPGRAI